MANPSPLLDLHDEADALMMAFGDDVRIVSEHVAYETEYAAFRKSAVVMDAAHRGLVQVTGDDRIDFLQRMLSGDVTHLSAGEAMRCFLLTEKGRIAADVTVAHQDDQTLIELDACDATSFVDELGQFLFAEDVQLNDLSQSHHCLAVLGEGELPSVADAWVVQHQLGVHHWLPVDRVASTWRSLIDRNIKPMGWQAYNIARIELGQPLYHIDFGPTSLPHETGIVNQTCNFTKGCYRGQEIVARMESLGHPRKILVGWQSEGDDLPPAGAALFADDSPDAPPVGGITSSCHSPRRSARPIGFAMIDWNHHAPGTILQAETPNGRVEVTTNAIGPVR